MKNSDITSEIAMGDSADWGSKLLAVMAIVAAMIPTFMELIDATIVNVAMPRIMASLAVSINNIVWIGSIYFIAAAAVTPTVDKLIRIFGQKRLLSAAIVVFTLASLLAGASPSFAYLLVFRAIQGCSGAILVPLSQFIVSGSVSKKNFPAAFAFWSIGPLLGPALGPILGGYLASNYSWRLIFFVNFPVGILAFVLTMLFVPETGREKIALDYRGFFYLTVGIILLEIFINQGESWQWFNSPITWYFLLISLLAFVLFALHSLVFKGENYVNFAVFKNPQFSSATYIISLFSMSYVMLGEAGPIFAEKFLGYQPIIWGIVTIPSAITSIIGVGLGTFLVKLFDARAVMLLGLLIVIYSTMNLLRVNIQVDRDFFEVILSLRNLGTGILFSITLSVAFFTLPAKYRGTAVSLFTFFRNLFSSIGGAATGALLNTYAQIYWGRYVKNFSPYNPNLHFWLHNQQVFMNLKYNSPFSIASYISMLTQQSFLLSFVQVYYIALILFILILPAFLFVGKVKITKVEIQ